MSKDRKKMLHIHSSVNDKQPTPDTLELGELGINNAKGNAFISTKNNEGEVVRFSEDETIINWMEMKEVFPYEGYVRGSNSSATGVTESDLLQNKSNVIIKLNQVVPINTEYNEKVNGQRDIYGNPINPISVDGYKDGAGFAIDMSRYAMIGANPSFSSLTINNGAVIHGNIIVDIPCNTITSTTLNDALCEIKGGIPSIPTCVSALSRAKLDYRYGEVVSSKTSSDNGTYDPGEKCDNTSSDTIVIPTCVSHLGRATLKYEYGSVSAKTSESNSTYDPGEKCDNSTSKTVVIPTSVKELKNWNGNCYTFDDNVCVNGTITASDGIFHSSDRSLKANIEAPKFDKLLAANNTPIVKFNYKDDESQRDVYGVIAQEVEANGINEAVYTDENGIKSVDYTSLMMLKIAFLENEIKLLKYRLEKLEGRN